MKTPQHEDLDLAERIRRYADDGAGRAPAPVPLAPPVRRPWLLRTVGTVVAAVATVAAVFVVVGAVFQGDGGLGQASVRPSAGAESTTPQPSGVPPSAAATPWTPSPVPGDAPIAGETPGPTAPLPERPAGVPGLSIAQVANTAADSGLACQSDFMGYDSETFGPWLMQCFGVEGGGSITVRVSYWRVDFIDEVHAVAVAEAPGADLDPTSSVKLFSALAKLAATPAQIAEVASFVATKVTGSDCPDGCRMIINAIAVTVETGSRGAASMTLTQDRP